MKIYKSRNIKIFLFTLFLTSFTIAVILAGATEVIKLRQFNRLIEKVRESELVGDSKQSSETIQMARSVLNSTILLKYIKRTELWLIEELSNKLEENKNLAIEKVKPTPEVISTIKPQNNKVATDSNSPNTTLKIPPSVTTTSRAVSYEELHCPKIIMVKDSIGNTGKSGINGTFRKGSITTLTIEIVAADPQSLPLYFFYTGFFAQEKASTEYTQQTKYTIDVTNAYLGPRSTWIRVDNKDGYSCIGADYDTQAYFQYTVTP